MRKALGSETTESVRPCAIFDLDGTLALHYHRRDYLLHETTNWKAFFEAAIFDKVNETVATLFQIVRLSVPIVICTGRPEKYRDLTERWLARKGLFIDQMYMRPEHFDGHTSDAEVKREMLQALREEGWEPLFAVEDRSDVTAMWREEGILCLQCDKIDFKTTTTWSLSDLE